IPFRRRVLVYTATPYQLGVSTIQKFVQETIAQHHAGQADAKATLLAMATELNFVAEFFNNVRNADETPSSGKPADKSPASKNKFAYSEIFDPLQARLLSSLNAIVQVVGSELLPPLQTELTPERIYDRLMDLRPESHLDFFAIDVEGH